MESIRKASLTSFSTIKLIIAAPRNLHENIESKVRSSLILYRIPVQRGLSLQPEGKMRERNRGSFPPQKDSRRCVQPKIIFHKGKTHIEVSVLEILYRKCCVKFYGHILGSKFG
jgi:hypothetical protein